MADLLPKASEEIAEWDRAVHAFLAEKKRRSGSHRTVQSYSRMLRDCFRRTGKPPDRITAQDVFVWAHGIGSSGREPSANTINSRISCLSSFFRFAIRMGLLTTANPCDALERPKIQPAVPRGLSPEQAQRLLNAIPNTVEGRR